MANLPRKVVGYIRTDIWRLSQLRYRIFFMANLPQKVVGYIRTDM